MMTKHEVRKMLEELIEKDSLEVFEYLLSKKDDGEITAFATFDRNKKLYAIDVFIEECRITVEKNE
jgi:hypothetical protein